MFNSKYKKYRVYRATATTNEYGETIKTYSEITPIDAFVSLVSHTQYRNESTLISQCTHQAITKVELQKGDLIENVWEVVFVENTLFGDNIVFLQEIENNGRN